MSEIRVNDQGKVVLRDSDNTNQVELQANSTISANVTFTLPSADGTADQVLKTDGSGNLSFVSGGTNLTWQTTVKSENFTASSGEGYFVDTNTSNGAITVTLPASPSAGDTVGVKDYSENFDTNNCIIARNSENIQGKSNNSTLDTVRASVKLVYVDATKGWLYVNESNVGDLETATFIQATGGTITTSGDYKIHTFTSSGTFQVTALGNSKGGPNDVDYMVVAGGGGAGFLQSGGGGAGGFRESVPSPAAWTASPLANPGNALPVSVQSYPITVGGGGAGDPGPGGTGTSGTNSIFSTITSTGGGGGGTSGNAGLNGGSGGGGGENSAGGSGNTPSVTPPQGNNGGNGQVPHICGGGGGGATQAGSNSINNTSAGPGGNGATTNITGSPVAYAGGGGGGPGGGTATTGGTGGGGPSSPNGGIPGTVNTGGGGGANDFPNTDGGGGNGGSGVVVLAYKFQ